LNLGGSGGIGRRARFRF